MNYPLVSIIVPCYNQAQYLDECLQSVLDQTYKNWECIIINDGSPDDTEAVALEWCKKDERFIYLKQSNKGVSQARNLGIKNASGNFIQFIDGDDTLQPDKIKKQYLFLESNPQVDIVYGSSRYFFQDNNLNLFPLHYSGTRPMVEVSFEDKHQTDVLFMTNICTICAGLYRKIIFNKVAFKDYIYEDWIFHIECSLNKFVFHYENFDNSKTLIRMTDQSQMIKHNSINSKNTEFSDYLKKLKIENQIDSKFLDARYKLSIEKGSVSRHNKIKKYLLLLIPPIFFILKNKIQKK